MIRIMKNLCFILIFCIAFSTRLFASSVYFEGGTQLNGPLQNLLFPTSFERGSSWVSGIGYNTPILALGEQVDLTLDASLMAIYEVPLLFHMHIIPFLFWGETPWKPWVRGFGFGLGPSYSSGPLKEERKLILLRVLLEFVFRTAWKWDGTIRIYHRSGAFGLLDSAGFGSNFVTIGIKIPL